LLARSARGRDARGVGLVDCRKDSIDGMIGAWSFILIFSDAFLV
jgi:hypothetical protein